jgi:hypothetical protein
MAMAGAEEVRSREWANVVRAAAADRCSWLHRMLAEAKKRAKQRGLPFQITMEALVTIAIRSGGRCEVSGIPFSGELYGRSRIAPYRQSLDRIESTGGYTIENCRFVALAVNLAMREWGQPGWSGWQRRCSYGDYRTSWGLSRKLRHPGAILGHF